MAPARVASAWSPRVGDARHAEVGELGVAGGVDHHVGRLDVAVDDPRLVRELERIEQLDHEAERPS